MTLLGVNDLQKYNTNNKATFYILFCCRCWASFVVVVCGREDRRDEWWMIYEVCVVRLRRRRQCDDDDDGRWLHRLHLPRTGQRRDNNDKGFIYIFSKVKIVHTTNTEFLKIPAQSFKGKKQAKQRERDGRRKRAVQLLELLNWNLNFLPEGTQRRTGRCTPPPTNNGHNSTTDAILSCKIIGPVYNTYRYNIDIVL